MLRIPPRMAYRPGKANEGQEGGRKARMGKCPDKNFLFEEVGLKATEIHCDVDSKGETITATLTDRGTLAYRLVERNAYDHLRGVRIHLFALNKSAKMYF